MYELPVDFDLDQLKGVVLEAVSFGTYKITLHFSEGWTIGVEDDLSLDSNERAFLPEILPALYPLVNRKILGTSRIDQGTIGLEFERGTVLHIYGATKEFECYQIERNGETLVVV